MTTKTRTGHYSASARHSGGPGRTVKNTASATRITEAALQCAVEECARALGYRVWHDRDSRRNDPGWPDLVLCKPPRLIIAELKTSSGRIRPEQHTWLAALAACGIETYLWRPRQWLSGEIEATLRGEAW